MMRRLVRIALVSSCAAVLAASVACGDGATATPPAATSTAPPVAGSTVVAAATVAAPTPTGAPSVDVVPTPTAPPQRTGAPPAPATAAPPPPTPAPPPPPAEQSITIVAKDVKFSPSSLSARAGAVLHLTLDNQDAGVQHDIVLYDASGAIVGATEPVNGPVQQTLTVLLDAPRYSFKCSVHPQTMNGTLTAQ